MCSVKIIKNNNSNQTEIYILKHVKLVSLFLFTRYELIPYFSDPQPPGRGPEPVREAIGTGENVLNDPPPI